MSALTNLEAEYKELFKQQLQCRLCQESFDINDDINIEIETHKDSLSHQKQFQQYSLCNQPDKTNIYPFTQNASQLSDQDRCIFSFKSADEDVNAFGSLQYLLDQIQKLEVQRSYLMILNKFMKYLQQQNKELFTKKDAFEFIQQNNNQKRVDAMSYLMRDFQSGQPSKEPKFQKQIDSYATYFKQFLKLLKDNDEILILIISLLVYYAHCNIKQVLQLKFSQLKSADLLKILKVRMYERNSINFEGYSVQTYAEQLQQSLNLKDDDYLQRVGQAGNNISHKVKQIITKYSAQTSDINFGQFIQNLTLKQIKVIGFNQKKGNHTNSQVELMKNLNADNQIDIENSKPCIPSQPMPNAKQQLKNERQPLKNMEFQIYEKKMNLENNVDHHLKQNDPIEIISILEKNEFEKKLSKANQKLRIKLNFVVKNQQV